jgi:ribosomal protein S18 acetylase RimI-like enzyme
VGGRSAAALGGYDPRSLGYPTLRKAIEEIAHKRGSSGLDPGAMKRSKGVLSCIPEDVEGAWVVESVATVPEFRRQGITSKLLEEMLERGRSLGFRRAQINIYIGNMPAQRLYEKYGFQIMDEKRNPDFEKEIGSPGMARLLCNL